MHSAHRTYLTSHIPSHPTRTSGSLRSYKKHITCTNFLMITPSTLLSPCRVSKVSGNVLKSLSLPHIASYILAIMKRQASTRICQLSTWLASQHAQRRAPPLHDGELDSPFYWKRQGAATTSIKCMPYVCMRQTSISSIKSSLHGR